MKTAINLRILQAQGSVRAAIEAVDGPEAILWTVRLALGGSKSCAPRPVTRVED